VTDIATLGLAIDSKQAVAAKAALTNLVPAANAAETAVKRLETASKGTTAAVGGAAEAATSMVTATAAVAGALPAATEEVDKHSKAVKLNGNQIAELGHIARSTFGTLAAGGSIFQALGYEANRLVSVLTIGPNGVGGTLKAIGSALLSATAAINPLGWAFIGLTAAAVGFYAIISRSGPSLEQTLKDHETAIKAIKSAWQDASTEAEKYGPRVQSAIQFTGQADALRLQDQLQHQLSGIVSRR
jgi:hypothetical protein